MLSKFRNHVLLGDRPVMLILMNSPYSILVNSHMISVLKGIFRDGGGEGVHVFTKSDSYIILWLVYENEYQRNSLMKHNN